MIPSRLSGSTAHYPHPYDMDRRWRRRSFTPHVKWDRDTEHRPKWDRVTPELQATIDRLGSYDAKGFARLAKRCVRNGCTIEDIFEEIDKQAALRETRRARALAMPRHNGRFVSHKLKGGLFGP